MRKSRFTLIELLCVIAVIAVLASLLAPGIMQAMSRSKKTVCINNFRQMGIAANAFGTDNNGGMPWGTPNTGYAPGSTEHGNGEFIRSGIEPMWHRDFPGRWMGIGLLRPWLGIVDVGGRINQSTENKVLYCPSGRGQTTYDGDIGIKNYGSRPDVWWISTNYLWNSNFGMVPGSTWGRQVKLSDPGRTPLLADQCVDGPDPWPNHDDGFTVLRLDGSVNFIKMDANAFRRTIRFLDHTAMYERAWSMSTGAFR